MTSQLPIADTSVILSFVMLFSGIALVLVGYLINRLFAPPKYYPFKNERFECGNPPSRRGRGLFSMQYYAYLVVFLTVEPVFVYLFLLLMGAHTLFYNVVQLLGLIILMLTPPMVFGLDAARRIDLWKMQGGSRN